VQCDDVVVFGVGQATRERDQLASQDDAATEPGLELLQFDDDHATPVGGDEAHPGVVSFEQRAIDRVPAGVTGHGGQHGTQRRLQFVRPHTDGFTGRIARHRRELVDG
jgi:hypothetical protein